MPHTKYPYSRSNRPEPETGSSLRVATAVGHLFVLVALYAVAQYPIAIPCQPGKPAIILYSALIATVPGLPLHVRPPADEIYFRLGILAFHCGSLQITRAVTPEDRPMFGNISWHGRQAGNEAA